MSNLYADRVLSEHPTVLFPLDDPATHISLISEANRQISNWTTQTDCTATTVTDALTKTGGAPFPSSHMTKVSPDFAGPTSGGETMTIESPVMFDELEIYSTIPVSATIHVWLPSDSIDFIKFGSDLTNVDKYTTYTVPSNFYEGWLAISTDKIDATIGIIQIEFTALAGQTIGNLEMYLNGLNVGQYSESHRLNSLGVEKGNDEALGESRGNPLGTQEVWYTIENNRLLAYNDSVPMVYGSNHCTRLLNSDVSEPSIWFPANGFWNESGKWNTMSVEFWLRISGLSDGPKKIFGPDTDQIPEQHNGLYVDGSVMSLSVHGNVASANVGIMSSPMLVHILYTDTASSLMINGEELLTVSYDTETATFPATVYDWLGFYTHPEFECFEIDCFSIFPYLIPSVVAKRRFVWGQGVDNIGTVNARHRGSTVQADFSDAGIGSNIIYPDTSSWGTGKSANLDVTNNRIGILRKPLPNLYLGDKTIDDWYNGQSSPGYTFDVSGFETIHTYMSFETLSDYSNNPESIHVIWETAAFLSAGTSNSLFAVSSKRNPDMFVKAYLDDDTLNIDFIDGSDVSNIYSYPSTIASNEKYITVLNFSSTEMTGGHVPQRMSTMLSNTEDLELVVGSVGDETFNGLFHSISISSNYESSIISDQKSAYNINYASLSETESLLYDISTYTVVSTSDYGFYHLDIAQRGHWSDYLPLSTLASTATNMSGDDELGIDHIQFNLGYPKSEGTNQFGEYDTAGNSIRAFASFQKSDRLLLGIEELTERGGVSELLKTAQWHVDAGHLTDAGDGLVDLTGDGNDLVFTPGSEPVILPHDGEDYLHIPAGSGTNKIDSWSLGRPSCTKLVATLDAEFTFSGALETVFQAYTNEIWIVVAEGNAIKSSWYDVTNAVDVQTFTGKTADAMLRHNRFTFDGVTVTWEDSSDGTSWVIVDTVTHPTALGMSEAYFRIGRVSYSAAETKLYSASIEYDDTTTFTFDVTAASADGTTAANPSGGNWAITRATTGLKTTVVDRPKLLFGGSALASVADYTNPVTTMVMAFRIFPFAIDGTKGFWATAFNDTQLGYRVFGYTTTTNLSYRGEFGPTAGDNTISTSVSGTHPTSGLAVRHNADNTVTMRTSHGENTSAAAGVYPMVGQQLRLGLTSEIEFSSVAVFDYALTDAEIDSVSTELQAGLLSTSSNEIPATPSDVVYSDEIDNIINSKIEIVDGTTIIVPRKYRMEDLSLSLYLEMVTPGSNDRPISVKTMELAGYNMNKSNFTEIGTKTGKSVYPHVNNGYYYDFNASNPFRMDKRGFPHLYLGLESGMVPIGDRTTGIDRGITIDMPETHNQEYLLDVLQFWVRAGSTFPVEPEDIFLFEYGDKRIRIRLSQYPGDADRGILTVFDKDMNEISDARFTRNGHDVRNCLLSKDQWTAVDLSFGLPIALDTASNKGFIKIYPGLVYSNVSYFSPGPYSRETKILYRPWSEVYDAGAKTWGDWDSGSWYDVYVSGTVNVRRESSESQKYAAAIGTDRNVFWSSSPLTLSQGRGKTIDAAQWQTTSAIPT